MRLIKGDIINVKRGDDFIGKVISWFTNSPYIHSICYIGEGMAVESNWGGVKILTNFGTWEGCDIFRHKTATKQELDKAVEFMVSKEGAKYDYLGLLGIGINLLLGRNKNGLDNKNKYWCSELIADGYHYANIKTGFNKNTLLTAPADFDKNDNFYKLD